MKTKEEIFNWLDSKDYQTDYEETHEHKMYYAIDMPKILNDFIADHEAGKNVIKAKALRKKGTKMFYFYHEKDGWFEGDIPELHYNDMDYQQMIDYYNQPFCHRIPLDAELIDIEIVLPAPFQEGGEG